MLLNKTPYHAYYWIDEDESTVWILAVWSGARRFGPPLDHRI